MVYGKDNIKVKFKDGTEIYAIEQPQSAKNLKIFDFCKEKFVIMVYNISIYCRNPTKESARKKSLQKQHPFPAFLRIKRCKARNRARNLTMGL